MTSCTRSAAEILDLLFSLEAHSNWSAKSRKSQLKWNCRFWKLNHERSEKKDFQFQQVPLEGNVGQENSELLSIHCKVEKLWGLEAWTMAAWGLMLPRRIWLSDTRDLGQGRRTLVSLQSQSVTIPKKFMKSIQDQWAIKSLRTFDQKSKKVQNDKPKFSYAPILRVSKSETLRAHSAKSRQGLPRNISLLSFHKTLVKETVRNQKTFFAPAFWVWQIQELCIVQRWRHLLPL